MRPRPDKLMKLNRRNRTKFNLDLLVTLPSYLLFSKKRPKWERILSYETMGRSNNLIDIIFFIMFITLSWGKIASET